MIHQCANCIRKVDVKLNRSPCGLHKLWTSLVHVHIATEVTPHLGATGLCFIVKGLVGDIDR